MRQRKTAVLCFSVFLTFVFYVGTISEAAVIVVNGFTNEAVQAAVNSAENGDTVFLPSGVYNFTGTVIVNKPITIQGASELQNVCVVEYGPYMTSNIPPTWSGPPSECIAADNQISLFGVYNAQGVSFENLKLTGKTTRMEGRNQGIFSSGYGNITVTGCEISNFERGIYLVSSYNNLIRGCYIHSNYKRGLGAGINLSGPSEQLGGSQAVIRNNEFMANLYDVTGNGPNTSFVIYKNYTHDDDDGYRYASFNSQVNGLNTLRGVIRDNIFVRTRPLSFKSGSLEISGNYFDVTCGNTDWNNGGFGYSTMCYFGIPERNEVFVDGVELHNIYFGGNVNKSGKPDVEVSTYDYSGVKKYVTYNLYRNGNLWEASHISFPPLKTDPKPIIGEIYVTFAGTGTRTGNILKNTWYDLHVMPCDPQGANNIAQIGVQLRNPAIQDYIPGNTSGDFDPRGNYFIESEGGNINIRETQNLYVDINNSRSVSNGTHRKQFIFRFKLLEEAIPGEWIINGYVKNNQGYFPRDIHFLNQEGWYLVVSEIQNSVSSRNTAPDEFKITSIYPNPFNPSTNIELEVPEDGYFTLSIYNVRGQKVRELLSNNHLFRGVYTFRWDGTDDRGNPVSAGVYFTKAEMGRTSAVGKMLLLK